MVKYALNCQSCQSEFEAWFSNSDAFDDQKERGLLSCPECGGSEIVKQIMAPAVSGTKKREVSQSPTVPLVQPGADLAKMMKAVREHIASTHEYVGADFAQKARAMHDGEIEEKPLWGEASMDEARSLIEDGVSALPLPEPFAPPKPVDQKKLN
ncbi:MAG: hypothetical protein CMK07_04385 [Ponticaulis sp.]|nr:hypothetical protein [Ponticaulis sp.]